MKRPPKQAANTVRVNFSQTRDEGPDYFVSWGEGTHKGDANHVLRIISDLGKEMERRGYSASTIKFEIKKP